MIVVWNHVRLCSNHSKPQLAAWAAMFRVSGNDCAEGLQPETFRLHRRMEAR
jgi:hypothetical protein